MVFDRRAPIYKFAFARGVYALAVRMQTQLIAANSRGYNAGFERAVECGMKDAEHIDKLETRIVILEREIQKLKKES